MADNREGKYETTLSKEARQSLPDPGLHNDGNYDTTGTVQGERELLGEGTTDEGISDDEYPSPLPAGDLDGNSDLSFDAVAPFKYPNFGEWPGTKTAFAGALKKTRD